MEYDIFISYSRKDTAIVDQFVRSLTDAGYRVWIDRDGIYSGDQFKAKIVRAIKDSAIVLYFSSVNSNASEWTVKEISYSLKKGKTIIPVKLDNAEYEDSIDFDLINIDFIQSNPNQPSACIDRLIASLVAHGCQHPDSQTNVTNSTTPESGLSPEELYTLGEEHSENKEYNQALKYFRQAAKQGHAGAQYTLGLWYDSGQGVQKDLQQAIYWYRKAAEKGHDDAQNMLGFLYEIGLGVEEQDDYQLAVYWYRKAAEQGNEYAIRNLERLKKLKKI